MEKVILVDTKDRAIGEMEKLEAHKKALLHRAISVFIFNSKGQMLLQKRALSKYHSPGLWTNTACTHPFPDESIEAAAERRLYEEMGISQVKLTKIFDFIYKEMLDDELSEYELDHVFIGLSDALPVPQAAEVSDFEYIEPNVLLVEMSLYPDKYTVWFKKIAQRVISEYLDIKL